MPFFSRKSKSRSRFSASAIKSVDNLSNPPPSDTLVYHRRFSDARLPVYNNDPQPPLPPPQRDQQPPSSSNPARSVHRSQTHRHSNHYPDRSSVPASWPEPTSEEQLALAPNHEHHHAPPAIDNNISNKETPRKLKKNIFNLHSSSSGSTPSFLEHAPDTHSNLKQMPQNVLSHDSSRPSIQQQQQPQRPPRSPQQPPSLQRSNTTSTIDQLQNPSAVDLPSGAPRLDPSLSARTPYQQSIGPPSPLSSSTSQSIRPESPPQGSIPYRNSSDMAGPERQTGPPPQGQGQSQNSQPSGHSPYPSISQESSFKGNASQQSIQEQQGRSTPTPSTRERRDRDDGDIDVRTLLQKHDELQAKYSKVKRYYFEKEAQVQHLQNTVAHQRMAVSRTVLDDNEYANRFNRVDGAIKDLAFSVRKDWKCLPPWMAGYVNEDAHTVGTKEMLAIGRAVMSRWVVDEIFHRHFHPALEPNFSIQLKAIEMNLRRQQTKTYSEEDKENAIARISNWRRTTFDGLTDLLQGPKADENRVQLIDHLVSKLVANLELNLKEPPPPGLDAGARMIVENAVGIADKIPLESRDVCIEYYLPGTMVNETNMKIEVGLPPVTNAAAPPPARVSVDKDGQGHDEAENGERESPPGSTNTSPMEGSSGPSPNREQYKKKSMLSSFMSKKQGGGAPTEPPRSPTVASKPSKDEERVIRFSSFLSAEVRGKGPMNVLIKAPVYVME
ncbi:hypothetical protein MW887_008903 [Aspergillus wentii]|nr:hypothetical protein MW887_008903 [Aspergillus wentii]